MLPYQYDRIKRSHLSFLTINIYILSFHYSCFLFCYVFSLILLLLLLLLLLKHGLQVILISCWAMMIESQHVWGQVWWSKLFIFWKIFSVKLWEDLTALTDLFELISIELMLSNRDCLWYVYTEHRWAEIQNSKRRFHEIFQKIPVNTNTFWEAIST